jgi:hypothetical protein
MGYQIAFAWSEETEAELKANGFEKREVYIKNAPPGITSESNEKGNSEFFRMNYPPFQFITTSYWGAGPG